MGVEGVAAEKADSDSSNIVLLQLLLQLPHVNPLPFFGPPALLPLHSLQVIVVSLKESLYVWDNPQLAVGDSRRQLCTQQCYLHVNIYVYNLKMIVAVQCSLVMPQWAKCLV